MEDAVMRINLKSTKTGRLNVSWFMHATKIKKIRSDVSVCGVHP